MALNQMNDRCDASTTVVDEWESPYKNSCMAEALVRVESVRAKVVLELMFCGHHYNEYSVPLGLQGFEVTDDHRNKFLTKQEMLVGSEN